MAQSFSIFAILTMLLYLFFIGLGVYVLVLLIFFLKRGRQALDIYIAKNKDYLK